MLQQRVALGKMLPVFLLTRGVGAGAAPPPLSVVERQGSARRLYKLSLERDAHLPVLGDYGQGY